MTLSHYVCQHLQRICQSCALNFVILFINIFSFLWFFYRSPAICIHLPFNFKANWLAIKMLGKAKNFLFLLFIWIYLFFFFLDSANVFGRQKLYAIYVCDGRRGEALRGHIYSSMCGPLSALLMLFVVCLIFGTYAVQHIDTPGSLCVRMCVCVWQTIHLSISPNQKS